jgi:hypothetical protein
MILDYQLLASSESLLPAEDEAAAHVLDDSAFTIHPQDPMKMPAYAPKDLRDPETDKPIFLQANAFEAMFQPHTLACVFSVFVYCI